MTTLQYNCISEIVVMFILVPEVTGASEFKVNFPWESP